jgi:hypothetical protein
VGYNTTVEGARPVRRAFRRGLLDSEESVVDGMGRGRLYEAPVGYLNLDKISIFFYGRKVLYIYV